MSKLREKYSKQLGLPVGKAQHKLRQKMLFLYVSQVYGTKCYRCGEDFDESNFSLDHRKPWRNSDKAVSLFWDVANIEWSHLSCNAKASRSHGKDLSECKRGHDFKVYGRTSKDGTRVCRECNRIRWHINNEANKRKLRRARKRTKLRKANAERDERDSRILEARRLGKFLREIAAQEEVSHITIRNVCKKAGLK